MNHSPQVYVAAGESPNVAMQLTPRATRMSNNVYSLDVESMRWSLIKHKGDRVAAGPISFSLVWKERNLVTISVVRKTIVLNMFDMQTEVWTTKKTDWPKALKYKPSFLKDSQREDDACAAIWEDKLYVFGGRKVSKSSDERWRRQDSSRQE